MSRIQWFKKAPKRLETRPARLFRDSDRDGVADVFDCKPFNRRRQDSDMEKGARELQARMRERIREREHKEEQKKIMKECDVENIGEDY